MFSKISTLLLPVLALANPVPQSSGAGPDPALITIVDHSYSGNGCPQGSVSNSTSTDKTDFPNFPPSPNTAQIPPPVWVNSTNPPHPSGHIRPAKYLEIIIDGYDKKVITFGFDQFQTYYGPGTSQSQWSKACQLHLNLKYPGGFQYAVVDATYHGWARLDKGVTGTFLTTYFFSQNAPATSTTRMTVSGGGALADGQVYTKNDKVETTAVVWSPCGTNGLLNINNRISLTSSNTSAYGELSNDDATVAFTQQVHVAWQPCKPGSGTGSGGIEIGIPGSRAEIDI